MRIRLKDNSRLNLSYSDIQNKLNVTSLSIEGCNNIDSWSIFDSIFSLEGNKLTHIRLDLRNSHNNGQHLGTWTELESIRTRLTGGVGPTGDLITGQPSILGTWVLKGMYEGEHNLEQEKTYFSGLNITVNKDLVNFEDNTVKSIVTNPSNGWSFEYDNGLYGVSSTEISAITNVGTLFSNTNITSFNEFQLFNRVPTLIDSAFEGCSLLEEITLPDSISSVGNNTFSGCTKLETLTYPANVSTVGSNQTLGCDSLEYVHILRSSTAPNINLDSFPGNFKIYVGDGSSHYNDNAILENILRVNNWKAYEDRLDTWYNKIYEEKLGSDYVRLDYVESNAGDYIDTELTLDNDTRLVADISFEESVNNAVYGNRGSGLYGILNGYLVFTINGNAQRLLPSWLDGAERLFDLDIKNGLLTANGAPLVNNSNMTIISGPLTFFGDSAENNYIGKAWMSRVYKNDVLVADFVPVYQKSTNKTGFYDCVRNKFYGFLSYSGQGYDVRLLNEDDSRLLTVDGSNILINNLNTNKSKISLMNDGYENYINYYTILEKEDIENKKLSLDVLDTQVKDFESKSGILEFNSSYNYDINSYTKKDGIVYKFLDSYRGNWGPSVLDKVERTYALRELERLNDVDNDCKINIHLLAGEYIALNSITSTGTQYIPLFLRGDNNNLKFEFKFKYTTFVNSAYLFGNYKASANSTAFYFSGSAGNTALARVNTTTTVSIPGVVTPDDDHTVVMTQDNVVFDGVTYSLATKTQSGTNDNTIALFASQFSSSAVSNIGLTYYYFKVYDGNTLIMDLQPYYYSGRTGMRNMLEDNDFYGCFGTGMLDGGNFSNPMAFKDVVAENNAGERIQLITDENGDCSFISRRNTKYTIKPQDMLSYYKDSGNTTLVSNGSEENIYITYKKKPLTENTAKLRVVINVSGVDSNIGDISGKTVFVHLDNHEIYKTGNTSIISYRDEVSFDLPLNCSGYVVFPTVSGYNKPSDVYFNLTGDQTLSEVVYNKI